MPALQHPTWPPPILAAELAWLGAIADGDRYQIDHHAVTDTGIPSTTYSYHTAAACAAAHRKENHW